MWLLVTRNEREEGVEVLIRSNWRQISGFGHLVELVRVWFYEPYRFFRAGLLRMTSRKVS